MKLLGDLFAVPAVEIHQRLKRLRFFEGFQVFAQQVFDQLLFQRFGVGQFACVEVALNRLQSGQLRRPPASLAGDNYPLAELVDQRTRIGASRPLSRMLSARWANDSSRKSVRGCAGSGITWSMSRQPKPSTGRRPTSLACGIGAEGDFGSQHGAHGFQNVLSNAGKCRSCAGHQAIFFSLVL